MVHSTHKPVVLVVDDTPTNLVLASTVLRDQYTVKVANNGRLALQVARALPRPDVILLDVMMPGMNGYEVCLALKAEAATSDIPVLFLTSRSDVEDEEKGFDCGAVDYIAKPISPAILRARIKSHLQLKSMSDFLRDKADFLETEVAKRTEEISSIQAVTNLAMASLAETRDSDTGNHIRRTQNYVMVLAEALKDHPRFSAYLTPSTIKMLYQSAPLHDIGKVGIPDHILLKPGRFEPHEFEIMKTHTTLGYEAIHQAELALGVELAFLQAAKEIALSHQEKWDGTGYPQGLAGDAIPISARLMAVADVYDALISRRVYKEGMPHHKAVEIILEGRGKHFDPDMTDAFARIADQFKAIAEKFADSDTDMDRKKQYMSLVPSPRA